MTTPSGLPGEPKPRIIYAVESGEYEDYRVDALFTSQPLAERFARWQDGPAREDPNHRVIERWLDEPFTVTGRYRVSGGLTAAGEVEGDPADFVPWDPDGDPRTAPEVTRTNDGGWWVEAYGKTPTAAVRAFRRTAKELAP